jgi:2-keto-4-pentenoate hydratase/2-oxohepta-3-ene-1,7-dioic acid hydratase in catechol pathway
VHPVPGPSKIVCVGRNYGAHARELGNEVPAEPLVFLKPPSALLADGAPIVVPPEVGRVDYEGEIAFVVGRRARRVREEDAADHLSHVLPANDVTARELQRRDGQWTRAKGFDTFLPVGTPVPLEEGIMGSLRIETRLNGTLVQEGRSEEMAFPPAFLLSWVSHVMTLEPGDLILTGTPSGVGPLVPGDEVEVRIPGVGTLRNPVEGAR